MPVPLSRMGLAAGDRPAGGREPADGGRCTVAVAAGGGFLFGVPASALHAAALDGGQAAVVHVTLGPRSSSAPR